MKLSRLVVLWYLAVVISLTNAGGDGHSKQKKVFDRVQMPSAFADGISAMQEGPNAREVSNLIFNDDQGFDAGNEHGVSTFLLIWGFMIGEEIISTSPNISEPILLGIPQCDPFFDMYCEGNSGLASFRGGFDNVTGTSTENPRAPLNLASASIDGEFVYGRTDGTQAALRSYTDGKFRMEWVDPHGWMPLATNYTSPCIIPPPFKYPSIEDSVVTDATQGARFSGRAGESGRRNSGGCPFRRLLQEFQNDPASDVCQAYECSSSKPYCLGLPMSTSSPHLTVLSVLLMREHNRLCDEMKLNESPPDGDAWTDEKLYTEARKRVVALLQHITFYQYLRGLVGDFEAAGIEEEYPGYDETANPFVDAFFASVTMRYGHSEIPQSVLIVDENWKVVESFPLHESFFRTDEMISRYGIDAVIRGFMAKQANHLDVAFSSSMRNYMFSTTGGAYGDIVAADIMRSRERGIPRYNDARSALGLPRKASFADISSDGAKHASTLETLYGSIDELDTYVGVSLEPPQPQSVLGETLLRSFVEQFVRIRASDPEWFERDGVLDPDVLHWVKETSIRDLIIRNTNISGTFCPFYASAVQFTVNDDDDGVPSDSAVGSKGDYAILQVASGVSIGWRIWTDHDEEWVEFLYEFPDGYLGMGLAKSRGDMMDADIMIAETNFDMISNLDAMSPSHEHNEVGFQPDPYWSSRSPSGAGDVGEDSGGVEIMAGGLSDTDAGVAFGPRGVAESYAVGSDRSQSADESYSTRMSGAQGAQSTDESYSAGVSGAAAGFGSGGGGDAAVRLTDRKGVGYETPKVDTDLGGTDDLILMSSESVDGVTTVVFRRKTDTGDTIGDRRVPTETTSIIYAYTAGSRLQYHRSRRGLLQLNLYDVSAGTVVVTEDISSRERLKILHGLLMSVVWGLNALGGFIVARYYRHTTYWLGAHRAVQTLNTIVTWPLIFVGRELADSRFNTTHGVIGYTIGVSSIVQAQSGVLTMLLHRRIREKEQERKKKIEEKKQWRATAGIDKPVSGGPSSPGYRSRGMSLPSTGGIPVPTSISGGSPQTAPQTASPRPRPVSQTCFCSHNSHPVTSASAEPSESGGNVIRESMNKVLDWMLARNVVVYMSFFHRWFGKLVLICGIVQIYLGADLYGMSADIWFTLELWLLSMFCLLLWKEIELWTNISPFRVFASCLVRCIPERLRKKKHVDSSPDNPYLRFFEEDEDEFRAFAESTSTSVHGVSVFDRPDRNDSSVSSVVFEKPRRVSVPDAAFASAPTLSGPDVTRGTHSVSANNRWSARLPVTPSYREDKSTDPAASATKAQSQSQSSASVQNKMGSPSRNQSRKMSSLGGPPISWPPVLERDSDAAAGTDARAGRRTSASDDVTTSWGSRRSDRFTQGHVPSTGGAPSYDPSGSSTIAHGSHLSSSPSPHVHVHSKPQVIGGGGGMNASTKVEVGGVSLTVRQSPQPSPPRN
eukprot:Rmarinus@m.23554